MADPVRPRKDELEDDPLGRVEAELESDELPQHAGSTHRPLLGGPAIATTLGD